MTAVELALARRAGIPAERIVMNGVGKRDEELHLALGADVLINAESLEELTTLIALAADHADARIGLRLNPALDARTHPHLATGAASSKFGIPIADLPEALAALREAGREAASIGAHIGSAVESLDAFAGLATRLADAAAELPPTTAHRSRRWPGHRGPRGARGCRAPAPARCLPPHPGTRPLARRRCRLAPHARGPRPATTGRGPDLPGGRCRHDRADPPDALRRRPPRRAHGARRAARYRPRSCRPGGTDLRGRRHPRPRPGRNGSAPRSSSRPERVPSWPSGRPARTGRRWHRSTTVDSDPPKPCSKPASCACRGDARPWTILSRATSDAQRWRSYTPVILASRRTLPVSAPSTSSAVGAPSRSSGALSA